LSDDPPASTTGNGRIVECGVDLGLKHLAWLSIGDRSSREDTVQASTEIARYCIDQPQLVGNKDAWPVGGHPQPVPNLKQKLIVLAGRVRQLQQRRDTLKQRYRGRHKHATRFFKTRREWQRCWRKMRHLHEEIARQVATRMIAACKHHGVKVLRFEDLSWSSHSPKRVSGAWLASWQVHWFFSQVQDKATLLARLAGIAVELVDARNTSKRCSNCGTIGNRQGKSFACVNEDCNKKLDSDLNGARNVRIAPPSPRLHAKGEGARYRPLACPV
jgi:transposase